MSKKMTLQRATEFGSAWNDRDPDLVASFFADDGVYHASVGPDRLGKTYSGKDDIRKGVKAFFDRFPDGRFENLKVVVLRRCRLIRMGLRRDRCERQVRHDRRLRQVPRLPGRQGRSSRRVPQGQGVILR